MCKDELKLFTSVLDGEAIDIKKTLIEKSLVHRNLLSVLKTVGAGGTIPVHANVHK